MFIPDPDPDFFPSRIKDPGVKKHRIPDPDPQHWVQNTEMPLAGARYCNFKDAQTVGFYLLYFLFKCNLQDPVYGILQIAKKTCQLVRSKEFVKKK
jgi:hypothetical protein